MNENLLSSYSFLAALSENDSDIYKTVYLPLFKRAISLFAKNKTVGTDIEIQKVVEAEYGITAPILIVRKLIKTVAKDLSRKERNISNFEVFEDGKSFQFNSFSFNKVEEVYEREKRNANALQTAFEEFVKTEKDTNDKIPSFACFIDKNKKRLSSFFSGKVNSIDNNGVENSFMHHANFLQHIERNYHELYKTAEQIYLGSIIASYLESEIDLESKIENGITYYLDTQIILEALDLQNAEDTQPTQELLKLIRDTGGKVRILDITIGEIYKIIESSINNYSKENPTTTINEACIRVGKNKTWLIGINGKLEDHIKASLQVEIDSISERKIDEYSKTEDVTLLKETRARKGTAAHDVIAYLHVRERRSESVRIFQKAKYWFITANKALCNFNISQKLNGFVNEIIMPEELTSLLFLKNPKHFSKTVSKIGLNELIAQTLSEEYASKEIINDFDAAIKSNTNLNQEDYEILLSSVAMQSTAKIQHLLDDVDNNKKFNEEIHKLIEKERAKRSKLKDERATAKEKEESLQKEKEELAHRLTAIEAKLLEDSQKREAQNEVIKQLKEEQLEEKRRRKKINIGIILIFIAVVCWGIIYWFPKILEWIKYAIKIVASLGGLWGLLSLLINSYKTIKR